jgi:paraquat-inducible protein B
MQKKVNTTAIGAFILGAAVLAIGIVIAFGSINLFHPRPIAVSYFPGEVAGLDIGAPVNLHGVRIGQVSNIDIEVDVAHVTSRVAVYMQFEPERLTLLGTNKSFDVGSGEGIRIAVEHGLIAQLASQSFVTGQLNVELSLQPGAAGNVTAAEVEKNKTPEIPTQPSDIEKLKDMLGQLPIKKVVEVLDTANRLLDSPEIPVVLRNVAALAEDARHLVETAQGDLEPLAASLRDALAEVQPTLVEMRTAFATVNRVVGSDAPGLIKSADGALQAAEGAMRQATVALNGVNSLVTASSPQRADIDQTLHNLAMASQSLRMLADQLERRPNAVLLGK